MKLELFTYTHADGWHPALSSHMDSENTLVLVFGASSFSAEKKAFSELYQKYPNSHIIGSSTAGEIFDTEIRDDTLSIAVMHFEDTKLRSSYLRIENTEKSFSVGQDIANSLIKPDLKGVMIISDGLMVNGDQLLKGVNLVLPESVVVTGGLAADGDRFEQTWVMKDCMPETGYISAIGFYGDAVTISHGSKGGWESFGPRRLVTKSKANNLYQLDGKPALALYKDYLGERASGLPATALLFPLAMHSDENEVDYVVRTVLSIDEEEQSMIFAGDIPEGSQVQLMRADFDSLIDGAYGAAAMLTHDDDVKGDILSVAISCVGRRLVLGERCEDEIDATMEALPAGTRQIGFYSYGEISPYVTGQACQLHNQTMTLTTISEIKK